MGAKTNIEDMYNFKDFVFGVLVLLVSAVATLSSFACSNSEPKHSIVKVITENELSSECFNTANATYIIDKPYNISGLKVILPKNSCIVFNGGTIEGGELVGDNSTIESMSDFPCLNKVILSGSWVNKKATSSLFKFDTSGATDNSINARSLFTLSNNIELAEGTYCFSEIELNNNPYIEGVAGKTIIQAVLKYPDEASCNKDVFIINNCKKAFIKGLSFRGDLSRKWRAKYGGGTFIGCENVNNVVIDSCNFSESNNYSIGEGKNYKGALINCYDCNHVTIEHCTFSKSVKTEHINIDVKNKKRKDCNVEFRNNHVYGFDQYYCGARGNSILTAFCNKIIIEDNLIEDFYYTGSIINCYALHTQIRRNIVRNCRATSVFDNCEYAEMWGETFIAENNIVECPNALCFVLQADDIKIENNQISCFAGVVAKNNMTNATKLNSKVVVKNNSWDLSHYSKEESLPPLYWRYGINIESNYGLGGIVDIENNSIRFDSQGQKEELRYPIKVLNVPCVYFCNNKVSACSISAENNEGTGIIKCIASTSKTVPMRFHVFDRIKVNGNIIETDKAVVLLDLVNESACDMAEVKLLDICGNSCNQDMKSQAHKSKIRVLNKSENNHVKTAVRKNVTDSF